ncbi:MAG: glycoside hydrolase family 16 protein [Bacteroidia bacterium]|nr:glycoside hydrolase family 16 protein [Bacteroidia bacterium]
MKKLFFLFFVLEISVSYSQIQWQINKDTVITYYYQGGDEFSDTEISKDKWKSWYGWARSITSNKEQQYYSDYKNHKVKNGNLYITCQKQDVNERLIDWMKDGDSIKSGKGVFQGLNKRDFKYVSGLIQSEQKYLKGYYEIKFKAPPDKGLWPAFWLYGGSPNEEIDIMELKGEREDQTHVDTHCQGCDKVRNAIGQKRSFGGWLKLNGDLDKGYNIISCLWDENEVRFYLNGKCIAVAKVKFTQPKHVVANIAVPANDGPFHPGPNKDVEKFSPFVIDYIRVWTRDEALVKDFALKATDVNTAPDNTFVKRSPKMLYGKKKEHTNDGIFVSLLKNDDGTLKLFCNGLSKKEKYKVKVSNGDQVQFEKETDARELNIPVAITNGTKIEIFYENQKVEKTFLFTR